MISDSLWFYIVLALVAICIGALVFSIFSDPPAAVAVKKPPVSTA
jgi:hypothetical protein